MLRFATTSRLAFAAGLAIGLSLAISRVWTWMARSCWIRRKDANGSLPAKSWRRTEFRLELLRRFGGIKHRYRKIVQQRLN